MQAGPPPPGTTPTCDSAGILSSIINVIASIQALEAIKIVSGNRDKTSRVLQIFDLWDNQVRQVNLDQLLEGKQCPTCNHHQFDWWTGKQGSQSAILCGRNAVQLAFSSDARIDLEELGNKLSSLGNVSVNPFLLKAEIEEFEITVFADGRAIIKGTEDEVVTGISTQNTSVISVFPLNQSLELTLKMHALILPTTQSQNRIEF